MFCIVSAHFSTIESLYVRYLHPLSLIVDHKDQFSLGKIKGFTKAITGKIRPGISKNLLSIRTVPLERRPAIAAF